MNCCSSNDPTGEFFDKESKKFEKKYRKKGLEKITKSLVDGIEELGIKGMTVLDVGAGIGGAHRELLRRGASKAFATELSKEMINRASNFTDSEGFKDKVEYHLGDIVEMNGEIPEIDITMHDKVICCYEHVDALIDKTLSKTKSIYAFIMPRDRLLTKFGFNVFILVAKLLRWDFRPFIHPLQPILDKMQKAGYELKSEARTIIWHARVFQKEPA